ncbi:MAG: hypothetical protein HDR24_00455 [Lachnospiraceae bacterium]|nr:hypothetical protein [Lachnospiraceae bacterium]
MSSAILKAIRDWSIGKFQSKGNYLTEEELKAKNYVTKDEISSEIIGDIADEVKRLIDTSILENMSGAKIAQDAEGNWGLIAPGTDVVMPFGSGTGKAINSSTDIANSIPVFVASNSTVADGYEQIK